MALPSHEEITLLMNLVASIDHRSSFKKIADLVFRVSERKAGDLGRLGLQHGAGAVINTFTGASGMAPYHPGMLEKAVGGTNAVLKQLGSAGVAPSAATPVFGAVGAALAPWVAAADIVRRAGDISDLHDLYKRACDASAPLQYRCICLQCAENIQYIIDKKERDVAFTAIGVATLGISSVAKQIYSKGKALKSKLIGEVRPKALVSQGLVKSARAGCPIAAAAIIVVVSNWGLLRGGKRGAMTRAAGIVAAQDGADVFQGEW